MAEILGLKTAQLTQMIDPDKKDNLGTLQTDGARLKRLARDWLAKRSGNSEAGNRNEEKKGRTVISGLPHPAQNDKTNDLLLNI